MGILKDTTINGDLSVTGEIVAGVAINGLSLQSTL